MLLSDYLSKHKITYTEFGRRVGASRVAVMRWATGRHQPHGKHQQAILIATAGEVQSNDHYRAYALHREHE